jgi:hypothetical protein
MAARIQRKKFIGGNRIKRPGKAIRVSVPIIVECGQQPYKDLTGKDGAKKARPYQSEAIQLMRDARLGLIISPTGSGKSLTLKGICAAKLKENPKSKAIIIAPQNIIISRSFRSNEYIQIGNEILTWVVGSVFSNRQGVIKSLLEFIKAKPNELITPMQRTCVCTHQALVAVFNQLESEGDLKALRNIHLLADECHRAQYIESEFEDDDKYKDQIEELRNGLGRVFVHWIKRHPGDLILVTATYFRSDYVSIISEKYIKNFITYELLYHEYLKTFPKDFKISFRFAVGEPEATVKHLFSERKCETIVYLPPSVSPLCDGVYNGKKSQLLKRKANMLDRYQSALGTCNSSSEYVQTIRTSKGNINAVDFVTQLERDKKQDWVVDQLDDNKHGLWNDRVPFDLIWALNLCREGFDFPALRRAVVIGYRNSQVTMQQIMGRGLRYYPGKEGFEFVVNIPTNKEQDQDALNEWIGNAFKQMAGFLAFAEQFEAPPWKPKHTDEEVAALKKASQDLSGILNDIGRRITDKKETNAEDMVRSVLDQREHTDPVVVDYIKKLLGSRSESMRKAAELCIDIKPAHDIFDCLRIVTFQITAMTLEMIRETLGRGEPLTEEKILEWCDAYHEKYGKWPSASTTNPVIGYSG